VQQHDQRARARLDVVQAEVAQVGVAVGGPEVSRVHGMTSPLASAPRFEMLLANCALGLGEASSRAREAAWRPRAGTRPAPTPAMPGANDRPAAVSGRASWPPRGQ